LSAEEIARIPVEARSLERLLFRLPGVTQSTGFFPEAPAVAINGANALYTNYLVDGLDNNENFLGGQRFPTPVGAVGDVTVLAGSYSVEFGRTANGVVSVTTPAGGANFEGEAFFVTRPGGFLSAEPRSPQTSLFGAPVSDSFARYQGGVALSGPVNDDTFFFLNAEYGRDATDNRLVATALGVDETLPGTNTQALFTARLDHAISSRWSAMLRLQHGRVLLERQGGGLSGGVTFPSAANEQRRIATNLAATLSYAGDAFSYAGALQWSSFDWNYAEPDGGAGPQATLFAAGDLSAPIAVIGHPGFVFDEAERTIQTRHKATFNAASHTLKIGVDVLGADFSLFGGGNPNGNFAVALSNTQIAALAPLGASLGFYDLPAGASVLSAAFETQPRQFGERQWLYALYAEDQVQASDALSLTFGLRWDYDSLTGVVGEGDVDNIAPRFAFNYAPGGAWSARGGVGRFVEKIPYAVISDAIQQNTVAPGFLAQLQRLKDMGVLPSTADLSEITTGRGNATVDAAALCTGLGACPTPDALAPLADRLPFAERRIFNPGGLDNPEALQASLGFEWRPARVWTLSIDAQYARGRNLLRLVDLNAPAPFAFNAAAFSALGAAGVAALTPAEREALGLVRSRASADATRPALDALGAIPAGGARSIVVTDSGGRSLYRALIVSLAKADDGERWGGRVSYTLSRLENDTDDINFRANDANDFDADYGPSLNDRTHVVSAFVSLRPWDFVSFDVAGLFQSGQPVNFVPDAAVFGTTDINGDGLSFADQFTGNPDRFPGLARNSGRLPWSATIDLGAAFSLDRLGARGAEIRIDAFNLLNAQNESGYPANFTVSNQRQVFGQPFRLNSAGPSRSVQLTARYRF
jgi:hypothetical protein